jgi:hypothetical protein
MPKAKPDIDKLAADRAIFLLDEARHFVMNLQHYWQQGVLEPGQCVYVTHDSKREAGVFLYRAGDRRAPLVIEREIAQLQTLVKIARLLKTWGDNEEAHDEDLSEAVLLARGLIGTFDLAETRGA